MAERSYSIRDEHKKRIMDYIVSEDGGRLLELKDGKIIKRISLDSLEKQIREYEGK